MSKIRVCLWATSFQANIYTFAKYLSEIDDFDVVVVTDNVREYLKEPINQLCKLDCKILERDSRDTEHFLKTFNADVTVVDNHYPKKKISNKVMVLWHGFGWKGPEDKKDFATPFKEIKKITGISPTVPNSNFRWICAGLTNFAHRKDVTGIAEENLRIDGQPYYDDIIKSRLPKEQLLKFFPESFKGKKIALLALTWHYGNAFSHWGDDIAILDKIFGYCKINGVALIMRMHDRKRFDEKYLAQLEETAAKYDTVYFKYRDNNRDNLLDILVADFMISNFSSMITYFYATLKPSIHIYPVAQSKKKSVYRVWKRGKVRKIKSENPDYIWSLPAEENGGLVVNSLEELFKSIDLSIKDPNCCLQKSQKFMKKHLAPVDGNNCARITESLIDFVNKGRSHPGK